MKDTHYTLAEIAELLKEKEATEFYGEITLRYHAGKCVLWTETTTKKPLDKPKEGGLTIMKGGRLID